MGPDLRPTRREPENEQSDCPARFLVTEIPSEAELLGYKIQYREGRQFFWTPVRKEDQQSSTWVLIRNNFRIRSYAAVIPVNPTAPLCPACATIRVSRGGPNRNGERPLPRCARISGTY